MNDEEFEQDIRRIAKHFPYPITPRLRLIHRTRQRKPTLRLVWVSLLAIVSIGGLIRISPIYAAIQDYFDFGAIRIFMGEDEPTPISPPIQVLQLPGQTTLDEARVGVDFPLRLPAELGAPDYVFMPYDEIVIMVWMAQDDPGKVAFVLHHISPELMVYKKLIHEFESTFVHGEPALWITAPHFVTLVDQGYFDDGDKTLVVEGNVLIWMEREVTYRLETDLPEEEAVRIAESLH